MNPAGRPPLPPGERRLVCNMRLRPDTIRALDAMAEDEDEQRTAMVERLVWEEVARRTRTRGDER